MTKLDKLINACEQSLEIMQSEKDAWDGACDLFDSAIEMCEIALKTKE